MTMVHARSWRHGLGITFLLLACVVLLCACEAGAPPEQSAGDVPAADTAAVATAAMDSASNPVQLEMRLLDEAIRVSITAIANDAPQAAVPALERVHGARMETEAYLHSGQYAPLADHDSLEAFAAEDEAFHHRLEEYAEALKAGRADAAAAALGPLMQSCVGCHQRFRVKP